MPDATTHHDLNPNHDWVFRTKVQVDDLHSGNQIGRIMIGKVPSDVTDSEIEAILNEVPLPIKDATPKQNCVTWTVAAIQALQKRGMAEAFDVNKFMDDALELADQWLENPGPNKFHNYTNRAA
ncbi:hypothetical protein A1O3_00156 [Capronia epimyces CBS 606.96]|uniref:Uncharacterized protein n=1 Tax=Capronia epimyces CBS 606.96 TaxID=1182542 RepID=W9YGD6_9EURO|nr:uncharacterized protein A1O3_00156 [Capronia epimyces CBS 606.96]EXJ91608.1 hypothetical protein A1O3_00156 [Capronia epimyces CBS 606.96]